jgi:hypothetical protein
MRRPWVENQATWNSFATGQAWQSPGAAGANDRGSVVLGTVGPVSGGSRTIALNAAGVALVQSWIDGTATNNGFILVPTGTAGGGGGNATVLANLLAFYDFEDTSGNIARDQSGNNRNGTIQAATLEPNGFNGGAFRFNGNGHVVAPIDINPTVRPRFTMGAWVRPDPIGNGLYKILGHDNGGWDRTIGLDERELGGFRWTAFHGNGTIPNTPAPTFNQWTFIAATYDNTTATMTLYVDLNASTLADSPQAFTQGTTFNPGFSTVAIGNIRPDNLSEPFFGLMDNIFFINQSLTPAQITDIRNAGSSYFLDDALTFVASESATIADRPQLSLVFTTPTPDLPGDLNGDGFVGLLDLADLQSRLGTTVGSPLLGDLNNDGVVNRGDVAIFPGYFGASSPSGSPAPSPVVEKASAAPSLAPSRLQSSGIGRPQIHAAAVDELLSDRQSELRSGSSRVANPLRRARGFDFEHRGNISEASALPLSLKSSRRLKIQGG